MKKKLNIWRLFGCIFYALFLCVIIRLAFVFPQNRPFIYTLQFCSLFIVFGIVIFALPGTYCFYKADKRKHPVRKRVKETISQSDDNVLN